MDNKRKATISDFARLCSSSSCINCLLGYQNNGKGCSCETFIINCPDKANEIILKWCDKHSKTYADDFFEKFPNAKRAEGGATPNICCHEVYGINSGCIAVSCEECWKEYKE